MKGDYIRYKLTISHACWRRCKQEGIDKELSYWQLRKLLSDYCDLIMEEVVNNPIGFSLPNKLGTLLLAGYKPNRISKNSKKKKLEYSRTNNVIYRLHWIKNKFKYRNIEKFRFDTSKPIKKYITKSIREDKFFNWRIVNSLNDIMKLKE